MFEGLSPILILNILFNKGSNNTDLRQQRGHLRGVPVPGAHTAGGQLHPGRGGEGEGHGVGELVPAPDVSAIKRSIGSITGCTITEKAPTRAFSSLKAPTSAFTFKTLLRHYA